ncbi:hypothetical protein M0R04_01775 [Candidatus Dojkabacteria bacterium]|jgi:hypothetical protein|nr:hypothetical protein [Candidatus Dojkabacteria bacterium]
MSDTMAGSPVANYTGESKVSSVESGTLNFVIIGIGNTLPASHLRYFQMVQRAQSIQEIEELATCQEKTSDYSPEEIAFINDLGHIYNVGKILWHKVYTVDEWEGVEERLKKRGIVPDIIGRSDIRIFAEIFGEDPEKLLAFFK